MVSSHFSPIRKRRRAVFPPFFMFATRTSVRYILGASLCSVLALLDKLPRLARFRTATAGVFLCVVALGEFPPMTKRI